MTPKVLYIGHYKDGFSGWATAAQNFIRAIDSVGIDVVPRAIKLNKSEPQVHPKVAELERKSAAGATVIIQNVLPHFIEYVGGAYNIGMAYFESESLTLTPWVSHLNLMDEIWVHNTLERLCLIRSGINCSLFKVATPCDTTVYANNYEPFDIPELRDKYVFYFIGEFSKRKNIAALLRAYHTQFRPSDNTALLIKVNKYGKSPNELKNEFESYSNHVKKGLKIPGISGEILVTDNLSNEQILRLHATGNCLVVPSYGEGECLPARDAVALGNLVIAGKGAGVDESLGKSCVTVDTHSEDCFGDQDNFPFLFNAYDTWREISVNNLQLAMWTAKQLPAIGPDSYRQYVEKFSFETIGKQIKTRLEAL